MANAVESCKLINFDNAYVEYRTFTGVPLLIVEGTKPYLNMKVWLQPRMYIEQPDYWGIEVVGCLNGIGLPTVAPYSETLSLSEFTGKKGIEVIGADRCQTIDIRQFPEREAGFSPPFGRASYTAEQNGPNLTIIAKGENPTPGYSNWIERFPFPIFPPQYAFYSQPPGGAASDVITPFEVRRTFVSAPNLKQITIHDAAGVLLVAVEQTVPAVDKAAGTRGGTSGGIGIPRPTAHLAPRPRLPRGRRNQTLLVMDRIAGSQPPAAATRRDAQWTRSGPRRRRRP